MEKWDTHVEKWDTYGEKCDVRESEASWTTFLNCLLCSKIHTGKINNCIYESFCGLFLLRNIHKWYIDFDINANILNKPARPILPHLRGKMGHDWGKLGIDQW